MPKVSSQRYPESNYLIIDPCYGREEDKGEEIQTINKTNSNERDDRMEMVTEMGGLIETKKGKDATTKNNLKIMNLRTIRITQ